MNTQPSITATDPYESALGLAQTLQRLAIKTLGLLNGDSGFPETIHNVVCAIQTSIDVEAVGLRLRNGDDFTFFASTGFSDAFLEEESKLTAYDEHGSLCRDESGRPVLECSCGLVVSGRHQNSQSGTCLGSYFTNRGESSLVFDSCGRDARVHVRGRCFREGYRSIAWVPVRARQEVVGLLLLCDKREDRFCTEIIEFLEGMSTSIGLALMRRHAEEELISKSAKLNFALKSVGMGVWSWDIVEDRRQYDAQTCRLLGIAQSEFTGTANEFFRAVHSEDRAAVRLALSQALASSGVYETEYRVVWKDGTVHYISARGTCVRDSSGEPVRIEGLVWDITERRAAMTALHRNEALHNAIISNISDVVAIVDERGINRFKSSNLRKWFGWTPEEVVGRPAAAHLHPDDLERVSEQFEILRTQPSATINIECRYLCKDGKYKWIGLNAVNLLHDPNIAGILLNYHDVSQRKRAQAALHESEELYRVLFQSSQDALVTLAPPNWQATDCNAAAVNLFRFRDASELKALAPWQVSPEFQADGSRSREKAVLMLETALRTGACSFEWILRNALGEDFPATVSLVRVELNGGPLLQATVRDESERQRIFAQMAQADRFANMGMLAGGVAHEINNPLAFVRYNLESLAEDLPKLTGAIRHACRSVREERGESECLQLLGGDTRLFEDASLDDVVARGAEALEGVERIISITRALSTFSRVEQVNRTNVNVAVAIAAAVNMAHNEVTHRARLTTDIKPLPDVWASEGKLSHAFLNLIVNAAQAIDEGDAANNVISIQAWSEGGKVIVEISDTGKGIEPANLGRIFEPFYTSKPLGSGPGLGLTISKNILAEFGGTLSASSEVGVGSRFTVRLPVMKEKSVASSPPPREISAPIVASIIRGRILVIDDEPNVIRSLTRTLGRDYTVVAVACGREAQGLVSADPNFDVILCDLMMSQVSGTEFHAWLAEHFPRLAKQLIFITGGAFTPKARDYLARVSNLTLEKPFEAAELRRQVEKAVLAGREQN